MKQKVKEKEINQDYANQNRCHHYWKIEAANGPKSQGVCKRCGEVRIFSNSMEDFNASKNGTNPLDLPKMPDVEVDKNRKS